MLLENVTPPAVEEMKRASGVSKHAAKDWAAYSRACRTRCDLITAIAAEAFGGNVKGRAFLDWGCAAGGVAILVENELPVDMYAADVDVHSLAWLRRTHPAITCVDLTPGEKLPFENDKFDCIYGISVLTHIPPSLQKFYLAELNRICKTDGVVILTVKSYAACDANAKRGADPALHPHDRSKLRKHGIIYNSYSESMMRSMDFTQKEVYGITYHSMEYVQELFSRFFLIERIDEKGLANQCVVVLRKRSGTSAA